MENTDELHRLRQQTKTVSGKQLLHIIPSQVFHKAPWPVTSSEYLRKDLSQFYVHLKGWRSYTC